MHILGYSSRRNILRRPLALLALQSLKPNLTLEVRAFSKPGRIFLPNSPHTNTTTIPFSAPFSQVNHVCLSTCYYTNMAPLSEKTSSGQLQKAGSGAKKRTAKTAPKGGTRKKEKVEVTVLPSEPVVGDIEDLVKEASPALKGNHPSTYHCFRVGEVEAVRTNLLSWYDKNQRVLPWRLPTAVFSATADESKLDTESGLVYAHVDRAYAVWVSEIMLQQTQVATVIHYYRKWMDKWPSVEALASATLEEVNEVWSGLGYYSRAKRLHEGAQKVMESHGGKLPATAADLLKHVPGVGPYTAGAIASIAYGEQTELVDGNVIRVLARMRAIGCDVKVVANSAHFWALAKQLVPSDRPGDFNQSLMELGATVCTPKNPNCAQCPVSNTCRAYAEVQWHQQNNVQRVTSKGGANKESTKTTTTVCTLCASSDDTAAARPQESVTSYPFKKEKKAPRQETHAVCVVAREGQGGSEYLMVRRPETGLLAGLWEFPSCPLEEQGGATYVRLKKIMDTFIKDSMGIQLTKAEKRKNCGTVNHQFSHVHHLYMIESVKLTAAAAKTAESSTDGRQLRWISEADIEGAALSTAMRKVFKKQQEVAGKCGPKTKGSGNGKSVPPKKGNAQNGKQPSITSLFARSAAAAKGGKV